jgi:hypothetical protein
MGLSELFSDVISSLGFAEAQAEAPPTDDKEESSSSSSSDDSEQDEKTESSEGVESGDANEEGGEEEEAVEQTEEEEEEEEPEEEEPEDIKPKLEEGMYKRKKGVFLCRLLRSLFSKHILQEMIMHLIASLKSVRLII